jgi:hypothetical protein
MAHSLFGGCRRPVGRPVEDGREDSSIEPQNEKLEERKYIAGGSILEEYNDIFQPEPADPTAVGDPGHD